MRLTSNDITPLQGLCDVASLNPGRCPGLVCVALSGPKELVVHIIRDMKIVIFRKIGQYMLIPDEIMCRLQDSRSPLSRGQASQE
jgi:hypothetical protein